MEKLVRDMIPGIMLCAGEEVKVRRVDGGEYDHFLIKKLIEEGHELLESFEIGSTRGILEELGDIIEVVERLKIRLVNRGSDIQDIVKMKAIEKGKFDMGFVVDFGERK